MSDHRYIDVFLKEEDHMAREMFRNFVDKEILPVRQQIDDDKEHRIVNKIPQGLTSLGVQKAAFPKEYGGGGCDIENPSLQGRKIRTIERLEGDQCVINGQKAWGSNAGVADA